MVVTSVSVTADGASCCIDRPAAVLIVGAAALEVVRAAAVQIV